MSRFPEAARGSRLALVLALLCASATGTALAAEKFPGIGRVATASEQAAWDIDVRPDFKGLPAGSGSVAQGQEVWEGKCASCHGVFGESNQVFNPVVGGTTAEDVKTGRVARLLDRAYPGRTTLMKVATLSTLWDYINRAMPWNQPKSLTTDQVYAVTAFMLNLGNVIPENFTLSDRNMVEVQNRMPNRNGMTTAHALWPDMELGGRQKPDVVAVACMRNCSDGVSVTSTLPDFARNQHGNLAEQNRVVGAQRGANTSQPETKAGAMVAVLAPPAVAPVAAPPRTAMAVLPGVDNQAAITLATKHSCTACHGMNQKIVGPAFADIAKKQAGKPDYLAQKIKAGGSGVWGPIPMPAQTLSDADTQILAAWIAAGAAK